MIGLDHSFFVRRGIEEDDAANCAASAREAMVRETLSRVYLSECRKRIADPDICSRCPIRGQSAKCGESLCSSDTGVSDTQH